MAQKNVLVLDTTKTQVNPSTEESMMMLRRIVKLLESSGTIDGNQRQRVAVEVMPSITVSSAPTTTVSGTITVGASTLAPVDQRYEMVDRARMSYDIGIRNRLVFS